MAANPSLSIGAHVPQADPVAEATARDADLVQFFLGDPQGYKGPDIAYAGGADALRAAAASMCCWSSLRLGMRIRLLVVATLTM